MLKRGTNWHKKRSQLMQRFTQTVQKRYQAGDMRALDVALATLAESEALMQQASINNVLADSVSALQAVSGTNLTRYPVVPDSFPADALLADKAALLRQLPTLKLLQIQIQLASAQVQLAKKTA